MNEINEIFNKAITAYETKKYKEAYELFEKSAEENPNAMVNLAMMHINGTGCEKNNDSALAWFTKAASEGNTQAMHSLGTFFEKGMHGMIEEDKAFEYYKKAADNGHVDSQLKTGLLYRQDGKIAEAMRYLIAAAHNNQDQAQSIITYVSNSDSEGERNNAFHDLSAIRQRALVENLIETKIRPALASDEGGLELVNYVNGTIPQIWLNYTGACSGCQLSSTSTADMLLDHFETMIDKNVILYLM